MSSETNCNKRNNALKDGHSKAAGLTMLTPYSRFLLYWISVNTTLQLGELNLNCKHEFLI